MDQLARAWTKLRGLPRMAGFATRSSGRPETAAIGAVDGEEALHDGFLSYSRRDTAFATALIERLAARGRTIAYDREDIRDGESWRRRLSALLRSAQNVIVLVSHASLSSRECAWELDLAGTLNKRLITVRVDAVDPIQLPESLAAVQWIDATQETDLDRIADRVVAALDTDQEWAELHTRLTLQALAWRDQGTLLRGRDIRLAEAAIARFQGKRPAPTAEHMALLLASRSAARRRVRLAVAGTGAVLLAIGILSVNWLSERRNAEFIELRRLGGEGLNQLESGDVAAAVASFGRLLQGDRAGMLNEYRPVFDFWRAQLRSIQEIVREAHPGELIDWRGTLYVKAADQAMRVLPRSAPALAASIPSGDRLVVADYTGVSVLTLPALATLVQQRFEGRVYPDAILAVPGTEWLLAVGSRSVVTNDEDEPELTESHLTLVIPVEAPATAKNSAQGASLLEASFARRFRIVSIAHDASRSVVLVDGVRQGGEDESDTFGRLTLDPAASTTGFEPLPPDMLSRTDAVPLVSRASEIHAFPQTIGETRLWTEASKAEAGQWTARLRPVEHMIERALEVFQGLDESRIDDDARPTLEQMKDGLASGTFIVGGRDHVWSGYISGNSSASYGVCRLLQGSRTLEWCRSHQALKLGLRSKRQSPDQTWVARGNGDSSLAPLAVLDLVTLVETSFADLPNLIDAIAFDPGSMWMAGLSETNELWVYGLAHGVPPRRLHRVPLGGTLRERCAAPGERPLRGSIAFAGNGLVVGRGVDGQLFAVDAANGGILWRRAIEADALACPDGGRISAEGDFFTVSSAAAVQLHHVPTGAPLGAPALIQLLLTQPSADQRVDSVALNLMGDVAVAVGSRVFVRARPQARAALAALDSYTGISTEDGRTPLTELPALNIATTP